MRRRILKSVLYLFAVVIVLLGIIALALQSSRVQQFITDKVLESLSEKYDAEFSIGSIEIDFMDEIIIKDALFRDQSGDTLLNAKLITVDFGLVNLLSKEIRIDQLDIEGIKSHIYEKDGKKNFDFLIPKSDKSKSEKTKSESSTSNPSSWDFSIGQVNLEKVAADVDLQSQGIDLGMGKFSLNITTLDLNDQKIALSNLIIDDLALDYSGTQSSNPNSEFSIPDIGWDISSDELKVANSNINYFTPNDTININKTNLTLQDIEFEKRVIKSTINSASFVFNNKVEITEIKSQVVLDNQNLSIDALLINSVDDNLSLESFKYDLLENTGKGQEFNVEVNYQTINQLEKYLPQQLNIVKGKNLDLKLTSFSISDESISSQGLMASYGDIFSINGSLSLKFNSQSSPYFKTRIRNLNVNLQDAANLWDGLSIPDSLRKFRNLNLSGEIEGNTDNLIIEDLSMKVDDALSFEASGSLRGMSDVDKLEVDLDINKLSVKVVELPMPKVSTMALDSLGELKFSGKLKGNINNFDIDGDLDSDLGSLSADLNLKNLNNPSKAEYKGTLELEKFKLGTLLKNDDLDELSIKVNLDGKGLNLDDLNSKFDGVISDFEYNNYIYDDININAKISDRQIDGKLSIDDKNVKLNYDGIIKLDSSATVFNFNALIDTLNLQALGFMNKRVTISGEVDSEIRLPLRSGENGKVDITNLTLANDKDIFKEDSLSIRARKSSDSTFVTLDSDFGDLSMSGQFGIRDIPASIGELVDYYTNLDTNFVHFEKKSKNLNLSGQLRTLKPIDIIFPNSLVQSKIINFDTQIDFQQKEINGSVTVDSFYVSSFFSERLTLNIGSESKSITANLFGENNSISSNPIPALSLKNTLTKDKLNSIFEARDDDDYPRLKLGINTSFGQNYTEISLSNGLILNRKDWSTSDGNSIRIYPEKLIVDNLSLTDNNEFLTVNSTDDSGSGLNIDFKNFNIGQFTTLLTSKPSKLSGNIDGDIDLLGLNTDPYYLVNLKVDDMVYDSSEIGVLTVKADDNQSTGLLTTDVSLIGPSNNIKGGGVYDPASTALDFNLDINSLQMMLLDPFLSTVMKNSEGIVTGKVALKGTVAKPAIDGKLTLENAITTIVVNNTRYGLDKQTVTFDNSTIDIGTLDIYDENNNVATIRGKIYHTYLDNIELDMNLNTDQFTFLNTSSKDNPVFFGKMILKADVGITGPIELLDVQVVAETLDSTVVNLSPFSIEKFLLEEDFITYGKPSDFEDQTNEYLLKLAREFPFKVNIILDATQDAKMNFVVDPITGDKIEGRGNGNLRIKLNPDGQQEIFGTYTISEGAYTFSYGDFVSKEFSVKPGGTVKFNGDPLNAILDINAIYNVYTTTYELIKNEISSNPGEIAAAKRRTNVEVYLSLKGTLDNPAIQLDIQVPDLESSNLLNTIDLKLNNLRANSNELNNQVFGLLIFNSFILSDNVASGFGNLGSNIALSSVSSLITNQLNKLADKVVKGVDVDINVNSYDSEYANDGAGGNVTEVGLKVSKQLFNDRLSVSAGGNFDLSGQAGNQSYSSLIGDFVLEYKLTESGRYRVRVFSKTDYDQILNQNTNKNGVSIFFNKAFDSKLDD